jgi:hypothetical protein
MATEGAGGLSTTAIEAAIDHWATHRHEAVVRDVEARAELAALVGRVAALEGALLDETARRLWTERVLQDRHGSPVGWDWDVGPAVREHWTRVARGRLGYARTVETLAELLARRGADAGRAATLAAENAALREALVEFGGRLREIEGTTAVLQRAHAAPADAGPGAAGARVEPALLDAAARYQDAWRVLAAGDVDDGAKIAHILDMHEAREDLFDATEVALRAGGAGETEG